MIDIFGLYAAMRSSSGSGGGGSGLPDITQEDIGKLLGVLQNGTAGWVTPPKSREPIWCGTVDDFNDLEEYDQDAVYFIIPETPEPPIPTGRVDAVDGVIEGFGETLIGSSENPAGDILYADFTDGARYTSGRIAFKDFAIDTENAQTHTIDDGTSVCDLFEITNEDVIGNAIKGQAYIELYSSADTYDCVIYTDSEACRVAVICDDPLTLTTQNVNIEFSFPKDISTYEISEYPNGEGVRAFAFVESVSELPPITPADVGKMLGVQPNGTAGWVAPPKGEMLIFDADFNPLTQSVTNVSKTYEELMQAVTDGQRVVMRTKMPNGGSNYMYILASLSNYGSNPSGNEVMQFAPLIYGNIGAGDHLYYVNFLLFQDNSTLTEVVQIV